MALFEGVLGGAAYERKPVTWVWLSEPKSTHYLELSKLCAYSDGRAPMLAEKLPCCPCHYRHQPSVPRSQRNSKPCSHSALATATEKQLTQKLSLKLTVSIIWSYSYFPIRHFYYLPSM